MIEFGKILREAREKKGYNISQLAEKTHILPQILEDLENESFTKIVAPIYGRGFIKLCCEQLDLDAKPLIDEFMEIFSGHRPPSIRMKAVETEDEKPEPPPLPELAPECSEEDEPPPPVSDPLGKSNSVNVQSETPSMPDESAFGDTPFAETDRQKRDYRLPGYAMPDVPRSYWRFGLLIVAAALIVALLVFGVRALYRATMTAPGEANTADEPYRTQQDANDRQKDSALKPQPPRKGVKVPPLYID